MSEEALQIALKRRQAKSKGEKEALKRRQAKSKGEKERYKHLNAEFQRIARRDKKDFFSNQCKKSRGKQQNGKD